jgi:hypothetical protein
MSAPGDAALRARGEVTVAVLLTGAALLVGLALQIRSGRLDPIAIILVGLGLAALVQAVRGRPLARLEAQGPALLERCLGLALAGTLVAHVPRPPGIHLDVVGLAGRAPFLAGLAAAAALVAAVLRWPQRGVAWRTPLLIAIFVVLGAWVIRHAPRPQIDVFIFQRDSIAALLAGENPYRLTFPNIYGDDHKYYGAGLSADGRLLFGFPYLPLSLFLALPGALVGGDFRYAQLAALAVAGAAMAYLRPGRIGFLAAALLLFSPRTFFVIEQGWTEPFLVALLALVLLAAVRWRPALPVALGLLMASKQYLVLAVPLLPLLWRDRRARPGLVPSLALALLVAAAVTLPLALWDLPAFWHSVALQFQQPFREDALSFLAAVAYLTGFRPPSLIAFIAAVAAMALAWRSVPRGAAGFAMALSLVFFGFFAFNKQAFCNYYFFVVGSLCLSVAAWTPPAPAGDVERAL